MASSGTQADYIVIGGGTSGLVVANRLSEEQDVQVIVLESGQDHSGDPIVNIPAMFTTLMGSEADYQFHTIPQSELDNRVIRQPQGKLLGGSSAINGQAFIAPSRADLDAWESMGNAGWNWSSLLPYFKKSYTLTTPPDSATRDHLGIEWLDEEIGGTTGPIKVSFPGVLHKPLIKGWIDAFKGMGYNTSGDPCAGKSIGGYSNLATIDPATKTRSYSGFKSSYSTRAPKNPRIEYVEALVDGQLRRFTAAKEVILAAGVYNTPKLLELSGIGDKVILAKHGIESIVNNPAVGENLQDHLMTGISFEVVDGIQTGDPLMRKEPEAIAAAQKLYTEHRTGPFTTGGIQSHAFMPILDFVDALGQNQQKELLDMYKPQDERDVEHYNIVRSIIESPEEGSGAWFMFMAQANLHEAGKSFVGTQLQAENFASLGCSQCHPFSRGNSHIASADVNSMPEIDPRYFSNPLDLEIMARHVQAMERLRQTPELAKYFKPHGKRNHPDAFNIQELDGAKKYLLDTALTTYHGCGTAAMLPRNKGGVVDEKLKVYGVGNLRIVDASIFPLIPRNNIMSVVYAVAERAADIIKRS